MSRDVRPVLNSKLCNNILNLSTETQHDLRTPRLSSNCSSLAIKLDNFKPDVYWAVLQSLSMEDEKTNIRQVIISADNVHDQDLPAIGVLIDRFLTPNLWWYVEYESYDWRFEQKNGNGAKTHEVVLERYNELFEPHLRHLASIQYPDSETCDRVAMVVEWANAGHPGWSSLLGTTFRIHTQMPYAIRATHTSVSNSVNDSVGFITASDCPTVINKWDCAFLTVTNCTVPSEMFAGNNVFKTKGHVFTNATAHGESVANVSSAQYKQIMQDSQRPVSDLQKVWSKHRNGPQFSLLSAYEHNNNNNNKSAGSPTKSTQRSGGASANAMFVHRFLIRPNHFYRSRIAWALDDFHRKNNITHNTRCVAAQMRRGDRIVYNVNMTELCRNWSRPITPDNPVNYCQDHSGVLQKCERMYHDKGCESGIPFGAVTLTHIVNKAATLVAPEVRTLIVFTDDEVWLNQERQVLKDTHPNWNIVALDAPKPPDGNSTRAKSYSDQRSYQGYSYMRSAGGTASGVYLHASFELAQQCEGFVAHFASGVPGLFQMKMCDQHGAGRSTSAEEARQGRSRARQGVCPPTYDMRRGLYR